MLQPISVSLASLNLITLAPMLVIIGGGLLILIVDLLKKVQRWQYWTRMPQLRRPLQMS